MLRVLAFAALVTATLGCEPSWSVRGQVASRAARVAGSATTAADDLTDSDSEPIAQAKVTLRCPGAKGKLVERTAVTDGFGWFEFSGNGPGPALTCSVVAQAAGHAPAVLPLDEACADDGEGEGRCLSATPLARLEKRR